jgi:hypothetical protein
MDLIALGERLGAPTLIAVLLIWILWKQTGIMAALKDLVAHNLTVTEDTNNIVHELRALKLKENRQ